MANVAKISVALTQDMVAMVREAVDSGDYASASELIREALRDWKAQRAFRVARDEQARRLVKLSNAGGWTPWRGVMMRLADVRAWLNGSGKE